jgi:imidazolonepropionase-like amidohydrolase
VELDPQDRVKTPAGAEVIDLGQATLLPGLIDAHSHLFLTGESHGRYEEQLLKESWQYRTIEAVVNARKDLEAGFTTLRDLETEGAMYGGVDVRTAINRGLIPGPRLQVQNMVAKGIYLVPTLYVYESRMGPESHRRKSQPCPDPRGEFPKGAGARRENRLRHRRGSFPAWYPGKRIRVHGAVRHDACPSLAVSNQSGRKPPELAGPRGLDRAG